MVRLRARCVLLGSLVFGCGPPAPFVPVVDAGGRDAARDATTEGDAGLPSDTDTFDPSAVYLDGTFSEGACYRDAIEDFDPATRPLAGFSCSSTNHVIRPTDGRWLYMESYSSLREFRPDSWTQRGAEFVYPETPEANDPRIDTTECARLQSFWVEPGTGTVLYQCTDCAPGVACDGIVYRSGGGVYPLPVGTSMFWPGYDDHTLVGGAGASYDLAIATSGTLGPAVVTDLADFGTFYPSILVARAASDGFDVVTLEGERHTLLHIDFDGTVALVGTYPLLPGDLSAANRCVLDGVTRLYCQSLRTGTGEDVVVRRTVGGTDVEIVHDEATEPLVRQHISYLVTGP